MKHKFYVDPLMEFVKNSVEIFRGTDGLYLFISIVVCIFIATFTYPKYHKQSYVIYVITKIISVALYKYDYNIKRLINFLFSETDTLWLSHLYVDFVYISWYVAMFSFFFWSTIGIMFVCNLRDGVKIRERIGIMFLMVCLICLFVILWYPTLFYVLVCF